MTDREKAIVMAYTGICTLKGDKLDVFYQYLAELYERPVYTHEWLSLDIQEKSRPDFIKLCEEEHLERKKGQWINHRNDNGHNIADCNICGNPIQWFDGDERPKFCCMCGAQMEESRK